jgi:antitoxin (DNA-binding transcriptional repressor) of toxin-antitoxin stability system
MSRSTTSRVERVTGDATVGVRETKTHLSELLQRAHAGEEITITLRGEPYAKLAVHDLDEALAAATRIQESAKRLAGNTVTLEELESWIKEGRQQ